jgi:formate-dependent nitrite reductase membrane component NrfD
VTSQSYYGRNIVKEPVWKLAIPLYFWTGGIAGASAVLHGVAQVTGNEPLAKRALFIGAVADVVSPILLVKDLGRPERFLNMFRMFKATSPMSVGSWILLVSGSASNTAAALDLLGILAPVKRAAEVVSAVSGPPLATYTGALVANTSIPVWSEARDQLPWLFGASATATAGAAAAVVTPPRYAGPARRAAVLGAVAEGMIMRAMRRRLGFVGEVYDQGAAGKNARVARACTTVGAGLLALAGRRPVAARTGGLLVLAGGLALRFSVFKAGFQSARDPQYTVVPQKERLRARFSGTSTG